MHTTALILFSGGQDSATCGNFPACELRLRGWQRWRDSNSL